MGPELTARSSPPALLHRSAPPVRSHMRASLAAVLTDALTDDALALVVERVESWREVCAAAAACRRLQLFAQMHLGNPPFPHGGIFNQRLRRLSNRGSTPTG